MRIDHQFSSNVKLYGSYTVNYQSGYGRPRNITMADFDGLEGNYQPFEQHNVSVGNTWVLNPTTRERRSRWLLPAAQRQNSSLFRKGLGKAARHSKRVGRYDAWVRGRPGRSKLQWRIFA